MWVVERIQNLEDVKIILFYNKWQSFSENDCHFVIKNNENSNGIKLAFADFRFIGDEKLYLCAIESVLGLVPSE